MSFSLPNCWHHAVLRCAKVLWTLVGGTDGVQGVQYVE